MAAHQLISALNVPRRICHFMVGEEHRTSHRMAVGFIVMTGGVLVAKGAHGLPHILAIMGDMLGYGIHALGATPFLEWLLQAEHKVEEAAKEAVRATE